MSLSAVAEKETPPRPVVTSVRTKAERALVEQFSPVESALPGGKTVQRIRRAAIAAFMEQGLPHRRNEEWKYTDLRNMLKEPARPAVPSRLRAATVLTKAAIDDALGSLAALDAHRIVFIDGAFDRSLSTVKTFEAGMHFKPLAESLAEDTGWLIDHIEAAASQGSVVALNTAYMTDGATLRIDAGTAMAKPMLFVFVRTSAEAQAVTVRNYVRFDDKASGTVVEAHVALPGAAEADHSNTLTSFAAGNGAVVTYVKLVTERDAGVHLATLEARLGKGANFRPFQMTAGGGIVRNDIAVTYGGEGGKLDLSGVFLGRNSNHIDTTLVVDHAVPRCESRELFKGVLDGTARGIFQGKIIVRPDAQKTDGKQMAQALMLSPDAEFDSKPELEIYADDVVCGHGSTAAEIDEDMLFYCRSRGIPPDLARALLIESFIGQALERVEHDAIRECLTDRAKEWLAGLRSGA